MENSKTETKIGGMRLVDWLAILGLASLFFASLGGSMYLTANSESRDSGYIKVGQALKTNAQCVGAKEAAKKALEDGVLSNIEESGIMKNIAQCAKEDMARSTSIATKAAAIEFLKMKG